MLNVGVVGCGYWGPNLIRNFCSLPDVNMKMVADLNQEKLAHIHNFYPNINTTQNFKEIINDPEIDAVAIATPVCTHYSIAMEAMENKKHVFVEKPLALSIKETQELIDKAEKYNLVLMVGHIFEFAVAVRKIKEIIDKGELGEIYYISCQRLNLGLVRQDINVMWDLAPHDISIMLFLLGHEPVRVSASASSYINPDIEDVSLLTLEFHNNITGYIHNSWLDPNKIRKTTIVGSKKMLVYDDVEPIEKIKLYYKGVDKPEHYDTFGEFQYTYRYGDIVIPMLKNNEPLRTELIHFTDCIVNAKKPISDGYSALRVIKILEAGHESLLNDGKKVNIEEFYKSKLQLISNQQ